ncbi:pseudouridine synthase [Paenibacillus sp. IHBB 10380]|uniref:pseudouridine synthase n=1 Tax=Paenibacillus sp. IHBB 10380 TaxID=1566358 RepID=UPI0005CF9C05|nr:pseudouridine synthase [Paenibacillus sp. IHBB 10380]AJS59409.1 RNA pseudouridine synthase [Paenibacillus sp. IHBB 10380]
MSGGIRKTQRLDKILAHLGRGSRSDIRRMAKQGVITVNGNVIKDSGLHVNPYVDLIEVDGERIQYRQFIYLMMHKPQGVISATEDKRESTVLDLLSIDDAAFEPFPVGRLDKDTEGLLLLTNDGKLAHDLLSPRKHVPKIYEAIVDGDVVPEDIELFATGVTLDDGYVALPGELVILRKEEQDSNILSHISLTIHEGKFHQVKRMFEAVGKQVVYLKRVQMGELALDPELEIGTYRELTDKELSLLGKDIIDGLN